MEVQRHQEEDAIPPLSGQLAEAWLYVGAQVTKCSYQSEPSRLFSNPGCSLAVSSFGIVTGKEVHIPEMAKKPGTTVALAIFIRNFLHILCAQVTSDAGKFFCTFLTVSVPGKTLFYMRVVFFEPGCCPEMVFKMRFRPWNTAVGIDANGAAAIPPREHVFMAGLRDGQFRIPRLVAFQSRFLGFADSTEFAVGKKFISPDSTSANPSHPTERVATWDLNSRDACRFGSRIHGST